MEQKLIQLPSLYQPSPKGMANNLIEFRMWEDCKKKAYHAELDRQIQHRRRSKERSLEEKYHEKTNISTLVQQQRIKKANDKYAKIKTEQKYMEDNYNLMKKNKFPKRLKEWGESHEHPFVTLIDEEQKRKKQTKRNFAFQNQLNDIQTEMIKSIRKKQKEDSVAEGKKYIEFVESSFDKQLKDRVKFQQKYLKLDINNHQSYQKQHLNYLKEQEKKKYSQLSNKSIQIPRFKTNSIFGALDQPSSKNNELKEKSGKAFQHQLSLRKQYNMNIIADPPTFHKMFTQRAESKQDRVISSLTNSNPIRYTKTSFKQVKQFKCYDIINNCEKIIAH